MDPGKGLVKRVIAVAGEMIEMHEKRVIVDGQTLSEPYVQYLYANVVFVGDHRVRAAASAGGLRVRSRR